jgi:hypothetical protein
MLLECSPKQDFAALEMTPLLDLLRLQHYFIIDIPFLKIGHE